MPKAKRRSHIEQHLADIKETKFHRKITHNIWQNYKNTKGNGIKLYTEEEIAALEKSNVADRLPPRATEYYMDLASRSQAITNLIKARPEETLDLSGERDPSNQLKYSPVEGLLHKYELVLLYVVRACSSWCRYCYRSDFLTNKTEKPIAGIDEITDYIKGYNEKVSKLKPEDNVLEAERFPISEALLSGGDPMVLSNRNLFEYIHSLAEAGVRTIRIGTKELAFFPERFDDNFFAMLDKIHELHPDLFIAFMVHFSHPDEILLKDPVTLEYIKNEQGNYVKIPITARAIERLRSRAYVTLENQTPIIDSVNDDAEALRLLQVELKRMGVNNHYYFQCREIEGHKIFAVPVEKAWRIHTDSQKGLSGIEKSRFAMSTEHGKLEVITVMDAPKPELLEQLPSAIRFWVQSILGDGLIIMKIHRTPYSRRQGDIVVAKRNPNALWITGYEDRILYDGRKPRGEQFDATLAFLKGFVSDDAVKQMISQAIEDEDTKQALLRA